MGSPAEAFHRSRYTTTSNPPPDLKNVCRDLQRKSRNGKIASGEMARDVTKAASREYNEAEADDLVRFLKNEGVLIPAPKDGKVSSEFYFDRERADEVQQACKLRRKLPDPLPALERISAILTANSAGIVSEPSPPLLVVVPRNETSPRSAEKPSMSTPQPCGLYRTAEGSSSLLLVPPVRSGATSLTGAVPFLEDMEALATLSPEDFKRREQELQAWKIAILEAGDSLASALQERERRDQERYILLTQKQELHRQEEKLRNQQRELEQKLLRLK